MNEKDLKELIKDQLREEIEKNKRQISSLNDKCHSAKMEKPSNAWNSYLEKRAKQIDEMIKEFENEVANLESRNEWLEDMLYRK